MTKERITIPAKEIPVLYHTEILVAGGGLAGVCAAVAAAREGAEVLLLEAGGSLGGIATRGLLATLGGFYLYDGGSYLQIVKGLAGRILERLYREGAAGEAVIYKKTANVPFDVPALQRQLDLLVQEFGVKVLFHQRLTGVITEEDQGGQKKIVYAAAGGAQGEFGIRCRCLVDCTGDGAAAAFAGAQLLEEPGYCQYPSMLFHLSEVNWETAAAISRENLTAISQKAVERRLYDLPRVDGGVVPLPRPGEARCNLTRLVFQGRPLNPMDREEISWGEMEGRRQAYLYLDFLRNQVPGYEMAKVSRLPEFVGVRESRRIRGRYVLTEEDVCGGRKFADGILSCAWPIELHALGSTTHWNALAEGDYYQIPLRSLMAQGFINLYMAGRCLSATRSALGAARICAAAMASGEAAGVAAGLALSQGCPETEEKQKKVKERLIAAGAWLGEKMGEEA